MFTKPPLSASAAFGPLLKGPGATRGRGPRLIIPAPPAPSPTPGTKRLSVCALTRPKLWFGSHCCLALPPRELPTSKSDSPLSSEPSAVLGNAGWTSGRGDAITPPPRVGPWRHGSDPHGLAFSSCSRCGFLTQGFTGLTDQMKVNQYKRSPGKEAELCK